MNINDVNAINEIKALGLDMINKAKSGHPGIVLSAAPIIYTLYSRHLNINPESPEWLNRDRFILSAGHGSALLYATLHLCGYSITRDDLKTFRSINSKLPGHPEYGVTPGVDISTGALGQGIANAVGIALGERYLSNLSKMEDNHQKLINFRTYVLCGDGDLMEGISYEACSFAGAQKLDKLMILYDCNKMTNDGSINNIFVDDIIKRFESIGFYTEVVKNSENIKNINKAIIKAKKSKKPSILIFNTILGKDSMNENKNVVHGKPLTDDDIYAIKKKLNVTMAPFETRKDTLIHVRKLITDRVNKKYQENIRYTNQVQMSGNSRFNSIISMLSNKSFNIPFDSINYKVNDNYNEEMRLTNHKILNIVASKSELFLGGNTDLASSTKAYIDNTTVNNHTNPLGRNIDFGIRESATSALLNGMATLGLKTFCSTMLVFSDYMKPGMRFSALMNLPITYIFTHDSIAIGEDGPTHQPIEQLTTLRAIPNMITFRPCDINEILGVWEFISQNKKTVSIVLSKNKVQKLSNSNSKLVNKGAYIIKKELTKLDGIIISTGIEVEKAILISEELKEEDLDIRVVSMPSMELFLQETLEYRESILPKNVKKIVIEPSSKIGWGLFTEEKYIFGINDFGYSGHPEEVIEKMDYNYESLKMKIAKALLSEK